MGFIQNIKKKVSDANTKYSNYRKDQEIKSMERMQKKAYAAKKELATLKQKDKYQKDINDLERYKAKKNATNTIKQETSFPNPLGIGKKKEKDIYKESWI